MTQTISAKHFSLGLYLRTASISPEHTGMHQVFERNMLRQTLVDPPRQVVHLRELGQNELVACFVLPTTSE